MKGRLLYIISILAFSGCLFGQDQHFKDSAVLTEIELNTGIFLSDTIFSYKLDSSCYRDFAGERIYCRKIIRLMNPNKELMPLFTGNYSLQSGIRRFGSFFDLIMSSNTDFECKRVCDRTTKEDRLRADAEQHKIHFIEKILKLYRQRFYSVKVDAVKRHKLIDSYIKYSPLENPNMVKNILMLKYDPIAIYNKNKYPYRSMPKNFSAHRKRD